MLAAGSMKREIFVAKVNNKQNDDGNRSWRPAIANVKLYTLLN